MSITTLRPPDAAYEEYVERWRATLAVRLPMAAFNDTSWDPRHLATTTASRAQRLYFTRHGSTTTALPRIFAEPVKAWVVSGSVTPGRMHARTISARWLWRALEERYGEAAAERFAWNDLQHADLARAEQLMLEAGQKPRSVYLSAVGMADFVRDLGAAGVTPSISYTPATPRTRSSADVTLDDLERAPDGVLTQAALDALADIFVRAQSVRDRLFSAIVAFLIATGIRWNELVTLPLHALEQEPHEVRTPSGGRKRALVTRVARHKAKSHRAGGAGRKSLEQQWLTDAQAELALMAVARLVEVTADAREVARRLEAHAPHWVWSEQYRPQWLYADDLVRVLGCAVANARLILRGIGEPDPDHRGARLPPRRCTIQALEIYMTDRQDWAALEVVKAGGGRPAQVASQSLLCLRVNEAHEGRATLPLITRLTHAMLDQWLTGDPTQQYLSVFERFEQEYGVRYRESDGSSVAITSHMCRRLFVTTGLRAGASTLDIARWQGREHLGDIKAYDKRSMADKVRMVKDAIRAGRLRGTVAQAYVQLADDVRDQWLENQVQSMHVTPLGLCVHDFTAAPCPYHLNCVKKCGEYLMDPNDPLQVRQLVQLERRTRVLHDEAQRAEAAGTPLAASYVEDLRETLENLMHILRMTAEPGELARPFAEQPSRHQPLRGQS